MFSGGGIAETYFEDVGVDVVVANELIKERAEFYTGKSSFDENDLRRRYRQGGVRRNY